MAKTADLLLPSQVQLKEITFSEPKPFGGGKMVWIQHCKKSLRMQLEGMAMAFDMREEESGKSTIQLSLGDHEKGEIARLREVVEGVQEAAMAQAVENPLSWLSKRTCTDPSASFCPSLRYHANFPPRLAVKLGPDAVVYDHQRNLITERAREVMRAGCIPKLIVRCTGVWIVGGRYGLSWKVEQVRIDQPPSGDLGKPPVRTNPALDTWPFIDD